MDPTKEFGKFLTDFTVLDAFEAPALCVPRLREQQSDWTLVERSMGSDSLFYLMPKDNLLALLKSHEDEFESSLFEILELHEENANRQWRDGRLSHPVLGKATESIGKFTLGESHEKFAGIVKVEADAPTGIFFPRSPVVDFRGPTLPPAPALSSQKDDDLLDCTLAAQFPEEVAVEQVASLTVTIAAGVIDVAGVKTVVPLSVDDDVIVRLSLSSNLQLVDVAQEKQTVRVSADPQKPAILVYDIKALKADLAQIIVRLFQQTHGAQQIGFVELRPTVVQASPATGEIKVDVQAYPPSDCPAPDLTVIVEELDLGNRVEVRFRISDATYDMHSCGKQELQLGAHEYFRHVFSTIEGQPFYSDEDAKAIEFEMVNRGKNLFKEILSEEMRNVFRDRGKQVKSVQIKTNGHHIPWEMIHLPAIDGEMPKQFLAERYQVTRWAEGFRAPAQIDVQNFLYTAPNYNSGNGLPFLDKEVEYIEALAKQNVAPQAVVARTLPVCNALKAQFGVFHYVGHARASQYRTGEPELELETEGRQIGPTMKRIPHTLNPTHVSNLGDEWQDCRPLVFLNACQTGQAAISLSRLSGWANRVLESRAGAFVGTLWSVRDSAAYLFATTFYNKLLSGGSFGESAQHARQVVAKTRDPSWLAYVVYAHPNTKAVVSKS